MVVLHCSGIGGGAARIAVQSSLVPAADARAGLESGPTSGADAFSDSGKKRKAEKEAAPSPLSALPLATSLAKRRQSPPAEAIPTQWSLLLFLCMGATPVYSLG